MSIASFGAGISTYGLFQTIIEKTLNIQIWLMYHYQREGGLMNNEKHLVRVLGLVIVMLFLLPTSVPYSEENSDLGSTALVYLDSDKRTAEIRDMNINILETYEGFVLADLTEVEQTLLSNRGFLVRELEDQSKIVLGSIEFDTDMGEPFTDSTKETEYLLPGSEGHYIIQLIGPIKQSWRYQIQSLGAKILDYVPNFAFIVKMNDWARNQVQNLNFVKWTGIYQPAYKISPNLNEMSGIINVNILIFKGESSFETAKEIESLGGIAIWNSGMEFGGVIEAEVYAEKLRDIARL
jgi:hypothetical protein